MTKRTKKSQLNELGVSYNDWAAELKISSRWVEDTPEKKSFMERIRNAKFQLEMDEYYKKKKETEPKIITYGE